MASTQRQAQQTTGVKRVDEAERKLENVLVGIPAYNEEVGIGSVVLSAQNVAENVLVVDDGSSDATVEIAEEAGATVVEHEENRGKGAAIRTVFNRALVEDYEAVVLIDGDGQHKPEEIPDVVEPVLEGDCDMAIGSRYLDGQDDETPLYRRFGQRVLDYLTAGSSGKSLTDTQSGFRAFSPEAIEELSIHTDGMGVESEMIGEATDRDLDIEEVQIDVRYEDVDGQTYNPLRHGLTVAGFILQLVRDRHPMLFFGIPGLAMLVAGGLLGLDVVMTYQSPDTVSPMAAAATSVLGVLGVLFLFGGLVLNQMANMIEKVE